VPGSIWQVNAGRYNLTNPASLVFPSENRLEPFELFTEGQGDELRRFTEHRRVNFAVPLAQLVANWASLAFLLVSLGLLIAGGLAGSSSAPTGQHRVESAVTNGRTKGRVPACYSPATARCCH